METQMSELKIHPVSEIFPLMDDNEYKIFKDDIASIGLLQPICLHSDGRILDGRNRYKACLELGIQPKFETWDGKGSLVMFVISMNLHRRHLNSSQKAVIAMEIEPMLAQEAKERQRLAGGDKKSEKAKKADQPQDIVVSATGKGKKSLKQKIAEPIPQARDQAAKIVGTNKQYVSDVKKIKETAPEKIADITSGKKTISQVKRDMRKDSNKKKVAEAAKQAPLTDQWMVTSDETMIPCNAVITDPPYGILKETWEPDKLEKFTCNWLDKWNECGADFFLIFWSQRYLFQGKQWFDKFLSNYSFQQLLVWHYPNNKSPQSRKGFKQTWEPIFFYRRKDSEKKIKIEGHEWGKELTDFDCHVAAVPQTNFNGVDMKQHPAQKPLSVMRWLINATTQKGEMVVDPFVGSGTTGVAACQMGRRFHGIEISKEYIKIAKGRLNLYGKE